jgi:threonine/homoserine/homoserine lactone efflux protein
MPFRCVLMLVSFELMLLTWLNVYGYLISRAGHNRASVRIRQTMQRVTGVVLIGLDVRLAFERRAL